MSKKSVTIQEIADHVGVSIATVSRVARGFDQISPATREKVLAAISELGYRPNHLGRALVERRHAAVGIVFPGLAGPYYSEVIQGFQEDAAAAWLSVLILGTHLLRESADLVLSMADRVDGLAITGGTVPDQVLDTLTARGVPIVQMAGMPRRGVPTVRSQNVSSMEQLTTHLISKHGYENLAFVGNPTGSPDVSERWEGFCQAH
ncbi:MAG: LacI family DNA-binding transcriptional regulator, partial [Mycobacterium sp.]|nr:LacI family DNA-binding transcriptional regulator [Mycobacterium sp.]